MSDNTEKARLARRNARDEEIWRHVERAAAREHCRCDLRKGMAREELPRDSGCRSNYVCPALDTYRRLLPAAEVDPEERALQESA